MNRILKIGLDVHTKNITMCALESKFGEEDVILAVVTVSPDYKNVLDFIQKVKYKMDPQGIDIIHVECGYEAGCLGYSLYHQLTACHVKCRILAPTTIARFDKRIQEIAAQSEYYEKVKKLECFLGIKTHTALSLIVNAGNC